MIDNVLAAVASNMHHAIEACQAETEAALCMFSAEAVRRRGEDRLQSKRMKEVRTAWGGDLYKHECALYPPECESAQCVTI